MGCTTPRSVFNSALFPCSRFGWFNTSCCTGKIKALRSGPWGHNNLLHHRTGHPYTGHWFSWQLAAGHRWTYWKCMEMHRKRARSGHITALAVDVPVGANKPHLTVAKWKHSSQNIRWRFLRCAWPRIIILHLANLLGTAWLLVYCLHAIGSPHSDYLFTCPHFCHNCGGYLAINGCFAAAQMKTQATLPWWKVLRVMTSTHHRICQQPQLRCARVRSLNRTRIPVLWVQEWTKLIIVNIAVVISVHHLCQNVYVLADIKSCWVMLQCCNSWHVSWWIGTMKSGAPWPSSHMRREGPFALLPCGLVCCPLVQFWKHAWPLRSSHSHHGPRLGMKPWQKRNDSGKSIGIPAALSAYR